MEHGTLVFKKPIIRDPTATSRKVCCGTATSFVNTFKRDYVARMDLRDAKTVLAQLSAAFEHFNEVHPHSSLKMRSPREFRRQQAAQVRQEPSTDQALYCE